MVIVTLVQFAFLLCFLAVVIYHVVIENAGPLLWVGILVTLSGMAFGALLAPKRRVFTVYSTSAVPLLNVVENRGSGGDREFDEFVSRYLSWVKNDR